MNKKYLLLIGSIVLTYILFFYFTKNTLSSQESLWSRLEEAPFLEYVERGSDKKFLYEIESEGKKIYLAVNKKIENEKNVKLLHTSPFWDPEICAGMQVLILENFIISKEARLEPDEAGNLRYRYFFYIYDKLSQKIEYTEIHHPEVVISPIFSIEKNLVYFFSKKDSTLFLSMIDLIQKEVTQRKVLEIPLQESLDIVKDNGEVFVIGKNTNTQKTTFLFSPEKLIPTSPKEIVYKNIVTPLSSENKNSITTQTGNFTIFVPKTFKVKFLGEDRLYGYFEIFNLVNFSDFSLIKVKKENHSPETIFKNKTSEKNFSHLILGISENTTSF